MSSKVVTIQFKSYSDLRKFMPVLTEEYELSFNKYTIKCHCNNENLDLAIKKFNARIIAEKK